ncbi:hypothetical protein BB559_006992 [Furculomyces boomerangus]|uniref:Tubulin-specific chaperone A n=2 Tax=Harpellales TaxID=61421 RepID=A0A2T9XZL1_9FUNG|nr:hypothetical protein BB559_006992 [Furculomyces boomerangus]PWA01254.1 hypothetical protein BB558_002669 [Smittium angustum]
MSSTRLLKIKTGSLKRLVKDKDVYLMEAEEVKKRIENLKAKNADEWDIKKQASCIDFYEVLEETLDMLPGCDKRIAVAYEDLQNLLESKDPAFENTAELAEALQVLATSKPN